MNKNGIDMGGEVNDLRGGILKNPTGASYNGLVI